MGIDRNIISFGLHTENGNDDFSTIIIIDDNDSISIIHTIHKDIRISFCWWTNHIHHSHHIDYHYLYLSPSTSSWVPQKSKTIILLLSFNILKYVTTRCTSS